MCRQFHGVLQRKDVQCRLDALKPPPVLLGVLAVSLGHSIALADKYRLLGLLGSEGCAVRYARVGDDVPYIFHTRYIENEALEPETETCVGNRSVSA